jgi:hypothetical protein
MSKIFNQVINFAENHVRSMMNDKTIKRKKREIAKYSFIIGFKTALKLLEKNEAEIRDPGNKTDSP